MDDFVTMLHMARDKYPIEMGDSALARRFGTTRSTVQRWFTGTATPHPAMQRPLKEYIENLLKNG